MKLWLVLCGSLVLAICALRSFMSPAMIPFPNLPKPRMRLKVPEKYHDPHYKRLKVRRDDNPYLDEQLS